jgi:hypothetical protein
MYKTRSVFIKNAKSWNVWILAADMILSHTHTHTPLFLGHTREEIQTISGFTEQIYERTKKKSRESKSARSAVFDNVSKNLFLLLLLLLLLHTLRFCAIPFLFLRLYSGYHPIHSFRCKRGRAREYKCTIVEQKARAERA